MDSVLATVAFFAWFGTAGLAQELQRQRGIIPTLAWCYGGLIWLGGVRGLFCKLLTCYNAAVRVLVITCLEEERARLQVSFELRYRPAGHGRTHGDCADSSRVTQTQHACLRACPRLTQKNSWPDD